MATGNGRDKGHTEVPGPGFMSMPRQGLLPGSPTYSHPAPVCLPDTPTVQVAAPSVAVPGPHSQMPSQVSQMEERQSLLVQGRGKK